MGKVHFYFGIDCAPGAIRPDSYAKEVFNRLGIEPVNPTSMMFGAWTWEVDVDKQVYEENIKGWIKPYMDDMYLKGHIRGAEWNAKDIE